MFAIPSKRLMAALFFLALHMAPVAQASPLFHDPSGDTFGSPNVPHDIVLIDTDLNADTLTFLVDFQGSIAPPSAFAAESVVGFIDIDADQDALSGEVANKSRFSPSGPSELGIEYFIDLFSERFHAGAVDIVDTSTMQSLGMAPISFDATSFQVAVPLTLIDGDGIVNYGAIVGDSLDMSDEARNFGEPVAFSVPEPASIALLAVGAAIGLLQFFRVSSRY